MGRFRNAKTYLAIQPSPLPAQYKASARASRRHFPNDAQQIFLAALRARFASSQNEFATLMLLLQGAVCPLCPPFDRPFTPEDIFSPVMGCSSLPN